MGTESIDDESWREIVNSNADSEWSWFQWERNSLLEKVFLQLQIGLLGSSTTWGVQPQEL